MFLVDVKISANNDIRIEADKIEGKITIDDCAKLSRFIESHLDRETEDFSLEVSSPGMLEPFKVEQQYLKNKGNEVEVVLTDGITYKGKMLDFKENEMELLTEKKIDKKNKEQVTLKIPLENIKKTKRIVKF